MNFIYDGVAQIILRRLCPYLLHVGASLFSFRSVFESFPFFLSCIDPVINDIVKHRTESSVDKHVILAIM